jgi:hypothetical protein
MPDRSRLAAGELAYRPALARCGMKKLLTSVLILQAGMTHAHLKDPNVPPCFEMRNEKVVPLPDTSAGNFIEFSTPELSPVSASRFSAGDRLNLTVRITGRMCSPYMVYIQPETKGDGRGLILMTSPSLVYPPGKVDRKIEHYVTLGVDEKDVRPGAEQAVTKLRLSVQQYGSYKPLASYDIPIAAAWRVPENVSVAGIPEYECLDAANIPAELPQVEAPRCTSSIKGPDGGMRLDLDADGICEWTARDERCDKIHGNRCFRVFEERNGALRPIAQFYNALRIHNDGSARRALSSVETGPKSNLTHYHEWLDGRYLHHMYLHDCKLLP